MKLSIIAIIAVLIAVNLAGCSGRGIIDSPLTPDLQSGANQISSRSNRHLWGYWDVVINSETGVFEIIPLRYANAHLNALMFLEPQSGSKINLENLSVIGSIVTCDIVLTHPFPGLDQYTGFDVRGIVIFDGSAKVLSDPDIVIADLDEPHVDLADGYTRWWNPNEFADNGTMFSYRDGKLGLPYDGSNFNLTVNGYRAFADALGPWDDIIKLVSPDLPAEQNRAVFSAGAVNSRHYIIDFPVNETGGPLLHFNYAVDASWAPVTPPVNNVQEDFPITANSPEPFLIEVIETENTLYSNGQGSTGGILGIDINVYDWQGILGPETIEDQVMDQGVKIESPTLFPAEVYSAAIVPGSGDVYSTWHVDINANPAAPGPHLLLVTVESSDGDYQPALTGFTSDAALAAYMRTLTIVSDIVPSDSSITITYPDKREFLLFDCPIIITWEWTGAIDNVKIEYSTDGFVSDINTIVDSTLCDGAFHWAPPDLNTDTFRIRISNVDNPSVFDISDEDSSVLDQSPAIWKTQKYDYARSGISPNYGPATNNLLWEVPVSSEMTPSPSIGSDGTIYVGTNDGYLYAVTPDGTILWNLKLGLFVLGSPTITGDGRIYAGSWGGATGYLHAIECDGDIVWEFDMGQNINHTSAAVGDDGTIYISNNGGKFFAINPDGTEKWSFVAGGSYIPSPALGNDGSIYLCTTGGNGYGVTDNGQGSYTIFWQHNFSSDHLGCPPSVDENNVVYITGLYQDTLWACDPFTDTILWTGSMGGGCSETSATVGPDGTVYIGCNDGNVYAFTPPETGTEASVKWTFPTGNQVTASPVLDPDGRLYVPSRDFFIYCLDSTDGSEIWKYETGDIIRSEVAIAPGGTMYVGGHDAILRAFRDE